MKRCAFTLTELLALIATILKYDSEQPCGRHILY